MANFAWKILGIVAEDDVIKSAKYHATATQNGLAVDTEGNWAFRNNHQGCSFADVTEEMVIGWIRKETTADGKCVIENRLEEQLAGLAKQQTTVAPWMPQTFTPKL